VLLPDELIGEDYEVTESVGDGEELERGRGGADVDEEREASAIIAMLPEDPERRYWAKKEFGEDRSWRSCSAGISAASKPELLLASFSFLSVSNI
jgi:hypothetical protein